MKSLFSIKIWLTFIGRIFHAILPAELILFIFAVPSLKELKKSRMLRLLILFIIITLGVRIIPFFAGAPFSGRYFLPFAITIAIFAASGIIPLVHFIQSKLLKNSNMFKSSDIYFIIIAIIAISYSLKVLRPRNDKPWLQMIPKTIKQFSGTLTPIIVSNDLDERFGYYANTTELYKLNPEKKWLLRKQYSDENNLKWKPTSQLRGIDNLFAEFAKIGKDRVFIILKTKKNRGKSEFDPRSEIMNNNDGTIEEQLCKYDKSLSLIGTFTDRKKRKFKLYKFNSTSGGLR